ncbi:fumarylacetoacetate hydrolase family protein [Paenibacillus sp. FSL W8-0186]|uniref:fumarylacetoacetate hydrolase family protein n=1 Tax=Paenibacillus sp. FSL W8-0186 TaxID=2921709 RepID=UPI0030D25F85
MKIALFNDFQLGLVRGDKVYDVGGLLFNEKKTLCPMVELVRSYDTYKEIIESRYTECEAFNIAEVRLRQPVSRPGKIVAAPVNYLSHKKEMNVQHTARGLGFFLKANTSIIGPNDPIILPASKHGRRIDHELELAFIIGKKAKNVKAEDARHYIFGFTGLNDVTLRPDEHNEEERCLRKSFDTFTPMGPWITTLEDIPDYTNINMDLKVNGEIRQQVNTKDMVCGIAELVEIYSHVLTLEPGDIIATGTPEGVAPIKPGDTVTITIEHIGAFSNPVTAE